MLTLHDFKASKTGEVIDEVLSRADVLRMMEALSRDGQPAVLALDAALPAGLRLDRNEKQHAGRMIRDRLGEAGWRIATRRPVHGGRLFSSGAVYRRPTLPQSIPDLPSRSDWAEELAAAQAIVRSIVTDGYSVDDFIAEKRAEAARENDRWQ